MKQPLDGEACFGLLFKGQPTLTLHFGDVPDDSVASEILKRDMSASLEALEPKQQMQFAAEMYPVMIKRFALKFPRGLDAEGLFDFLAENDEEVSYLYETAFCSAETYSRLFRELAAKARLDQGLSADVDGSQLFWFPVEAGQCLTIIHFSLNRLPGKRAVA